MTHTSFNPDLGLDLENLLLGLAWLGEATTQQIHRLWRRMAISSIPAASSWI